MLNKVLIENSSTQQRPQNDIDLDTVKQPDNNELSLAINNLQQECFHARKALEENIDPNIDDADFVTELLGLNTTEDLDAIIDIDGLNNITILEEQEPELQRIASEDVTPHNNFKNHTDLSPKLTSTTFEQETQSKDDSDKDWTESESGSEQAVQNTLESNKTDNNENAENGVGLNDYNKKLHRTEIDSEETESVNPTNKMRKRKKNRLSDCNDWECNVNKKKREKGDMYLGRKNNKFVIKKNTRKIKNRCLCSKERNNGLQCYTINEEERQYAFKKFWNYSWKEKQVYVLGRTMSEEPKRARNRKEDGTSRRTASFLFFFG